ncbi:hypothetical protein A3A38_01015 [Candidatus Kaiserbacteria bacterium RIFCSPLOWO2_01_FULL_53_17]|uniref:Uncharacterized protein n=1 Tax=Candidatus Kaiserbacteria bacterium RIFCSPLOWO2_01_FULL_53_17 TaxID=1798511 RepID=A0A1F6EHA3_9BACT|nr:MAG: hypothetical protein A3A38_01015 [Candidatus Kaiserbacteria bacterium RIFCSPLOWO2_01_FULL_53_17]
MKVSELGDLGKEVRCIVARALADWPPRNGRRVTIEDVSQDMSTDEGGTLVVHVQTSAHTHWKVRINKETLVDAVLF